MLFRSVSKKDRSFALSTDPVLIELQKSIGNEKNLTIS